GAGGHVVLLERLDGLVGGAPAYPVLDESVDLLAVTHAARYRGEAGIGGQLRPSDGGDDVSPLRVRHRADRDPAVAGPVRVEGDGAGMAVAPRLDAHAGGGGLAPGGE